jgi:RNA polymerase sigma factor (sigma-70 family)
MGQKGKSKYQLAVEAYSEDRSEKNKHILVEVNLGLVVRIAKRYKYSEVDFDDLMQEGVKGLMVAADKYDIKVGCAFSTFATWWIKNAIDRYVMSNHGMMRKPAYVKEQITKIQTCLEYYRVEMHRNPTNREISGYVGLDMYTVMVLKDIMMHVISLDQSLSDGENDEGISSLLEVLPSNQVVESIYDGSFYQSLNDILSTLADRERFIVEKFFGLRRSVDDEEHEAMPISEIAKELNLSSVMIRLLLNRALSRIKFNHKTKTLLPYYQDDTYDQWCVDKI